MWAWISLSNQGSCIIVRCSSSPPYLSHNAVLWIHPYIDSCTWGPLDCRGRSHRSYRHGSHTRWRLNARYTVSEWVCEWVSEWVSGWVSEWVSDTESDSEREWHWERVTLRESDRARESEWTRENGWARESGLAGVTDRLTDWLTKVGTS